MSWFGAKLNGYFPIHAILETLPFVALGQQSWGRGCASNEVFATGTAPVDGGLLLLAEQGRRVVAMGKLAHFAAPNYHPQGSVDELLDLVPGDVGVERIGVFSSHAETVGVLRLAPQFR